MRRCVERRPVERQRVQGRGAVDERRGAVMAGLGGLTRLGTVGALGGGAVVGSVLGLAAGLLVTPLLSAALQDLLPVEGGFVFAPAVALALGAGVLLRGIDQLGGDVLMIVSALPLLYTLFAGFFRRR